MAKLKANEVRVGVDTFQRYNPNSFRSEVFTEGSDWKYIIKYFDRKTERGSKAAARRFADSVVIKREKK